MSHKFVTVAVKKDTEPLVIGRIVGNIAMGIERLDFIAPVVRRNHY